MTKSRCYQEIGNQIIMPTPVSDCGVGMIESLQEQQFYQILECRLS